MNTEFKNGLPWNTGMHKDYKEDILYFNLTQWIKRIKGKKAAFIVIDGTVGEGKTTLATHILNIAMQIWNNNKEDIKFKDYLYTGKEEFIAGLNEQLSNNRHGILYDEAGDYNKQTYRTNQGIEVSRNFEICRVYKLFTILTLPSFFDLPNHLFTSNYVRAVIHCHSRTMSHGKFSLYSLPTCLYMRDYAQKHTAKRNQAYSIFQPNFRGNWYNHTPEKDKELEDLTMKKKLDISIQTSVRLNDWTNYKEITRETGYTQKHIRNTLKEMKIEPVKIIRKVKYFDKKDIKALYKRLKNTK